MKASEAKKIIDALDPNTEVRLEIQSRHHQTRPRPYDDSPNQPSSQFSGYSSNQADSNVINDR